MISGIPSVQQTLDVCVGDPEKRADAERPNCGRCWKCGRHQVILEMLGYLDSYADVFDVEAYRAHRSEIIGAVLNRSRSKKVSTVADREALAEMKLTWGGLPWQSEVWARVHELRGIGRGIRRRLPKGTKL